jgi:hypothetical protein
MNPFFDRLGEMWARALHKRNVDADPPILTSAVADELLELARVSAHTQERRFAPLVSYTAGVAAERLRRARPQLTESDLAELVREVRQELERSDGQETTRDGAE